VSRTPPRYAFVFVCQAGELEIKALLLAASLKRFLRCEYELIAALPTPASIWGELAPETLELLRQLDVRIEPIVNPIDPDYKIGNKLACFDVPTRADRIVFLDSDILCLRDFGEPDCLQVPFAAKPADLRTFAAGAEAWRPLYAAAGVELPRLRLPTTVSGEFGLAYFNSGVIFADAGSGIGKAWVECARTILQVPSMREQRHWLDQVSLAIAVHKLGLAYASLDERFNFPAHLKPVPDALPFFCHYHWPRVIGREPLLLELVRDFAREYPAIAGRMAGNAEWKPLLHAVAAGSLDIGVNEFAVARIVLGVDQAKIDARLDAQPVALQPDLDDMRAADQDRFGDAFLQHHLGCTQHALVLAIGIDDALGGRRLG